MKNTRIAFIGAGNMARSLIGGLLESGQPPDTLYVSDINPEQLKTLHSNSGILTTQDSHIAADAAEVVVLAVKPQVIHTVIEDLSDVLRRNRPLIVSIAAGVREADISRWIGDDPAVVRCMPNTPSLFGVGATALYANHAVSEEQKQLAEKSAAYQPAPPTRLKAKIYSTPLPLFQAADRHTFFSWLKA